VLKRVLRRWPFWSVGSKVRLDIYRRPYYAYGIDRACVLARALNVPEVSVIEFGVAGGNGLRLIEDYAEEIGRHHSVGVRVFGFDAGTGLPAPQDERDLPFAWRRGFYTMDEPALRATLRRAELIIGDVSRTLDAFRASAPPPVGFISFDLDYYSSTVDAMKLFDLPHDRFLPRVLCYFDDVIGPDHELHGRHVGELAAIEHFNTTRPRMKIDAINGLRHKRVFHAGWCEQMYCLHRFDHPHYATYAGPTPDRQLPLK
jgi:hypothetical protein